MSPAHKQRLVGAIVLVALGLIIVPTMLDFSRDERTDQEGVEIPVGPDIMQMEVLPLDDWSQKIEPGITPQEQEFDDEVMGDVVEAIEPPEPMSGAATGAVKHDAVPVQKAPKATTVPEMRADTPVVVKSVPESKPVSKPVEVSAGTGQWVVQVASLSAEVKANGLRDQLRKAGFPALVEQARSKGGTVYRVKAGPVRSRTEADELKKRIKQSTKLDGLVMKAQ